MSENSCSSVQIELDDETLDSIVDEYFSFIPDDCDSPEYLPCRSHHVGLRDLEHPGVDCAHLGSQGPEEFSPHCPVAPVEESVHIASQVRESSVQCSQVPVDLLSNCSQVPGDKLLRRYCEPGEDSVNFESILDEEFAFLKDAYDDSTNRTQSHGRSSNQCEAPNGLNTTPPERAQGTCVPYPLGYDDPPYSNIYIKRSVSKEEGTVCISVSDEEPHIIHNENKSNAESIVNNAGQTSSKSCDYSVKISIPDTNNKQSPSSCSDKKNVPSTSPLLSCDPRNETGSAPANDALSSASAVSLNSPKIVLSNVSIKIPSCEESKIDHLPLLINSKSAVSDPDLSREPFINSQVNAELIGNLIPHIRGDFPYENEVSVDFSANNAASEYDHVEHDHVNKNAEHDTVRDHIASDREVHDSVAKIQAINDNDANEYVGNHNAQHCHEFNNTENDDSVIENVENDHDINSLIENDRMVYDLADPDPRMDNTPIVNDNVISDNVEHSHERNHNVKNRHEISDNVRDHEMASYVENDRMINDETGKVQAIIERVENDVPSQSFGTESEWAKLRTLDLEMEMLEMDDHVVPSTSIQPESEQILYGPNYDQDMHVDSEAASINSLDTIEMDSVGNKHLQPYDRHPFPSLSELDYQNSPSDFDPMNNYSNAEEDIRDISMKIENPADLANFCVPNQETAKEGLYAEESQRDVSGHFRSSIRSGASSSLSGVIRRSMRRMRKMRLSGKKTKQKRVPVSEETGVRRNFPERPEFGLPSVRSPSSSAVLLPSLMAALVTGESPRETLPSPDEIGQPTNLSLQNSTSSVNETSSGLGSADSPLEAAISAGGRDPQLHHVSRILPSPDDAARLPQLAPGSSSSSLTSLHGAHSPSSLVIRIPCPSTPLRNQFVVPNRSARSPRRGLPDHRQQPSISHNSHHRSRNARNQARADRSSRSSRPSSTDSSSIDQNRHGRHSSDPAPSSPSTDTISSSQGHRSSAPRVSRSHTDSDIFASSNISEFGGRDRTESSFWDLPRGREEPPEDTFHSRRTLWPHSHSGSMAMLAVTLNLFNISRFAVLGAHFGCEFFIQWLIISALIGLPLMSFLASLGQAVGRSCVDLWAVSPIFKGIGFSMLLLEMVLGIYCCVPVAWLFTYFRDSFDMRRLRCYLPSSCDVPQNLTNEINNYVKGYLSINVLQRYDGTSTVLNNLGSIKFDLSFNIALIWVISFLALSRGPRSYGKVCYLIISLSLSCFLAVGFYLVYWSKPVLVLTPLSRFFLNRHSWLAASREAFLVWCLHGTVLIQAGSNNKKRHRLWKDVFFVAVVTVLGLGLATVCGLVVFHEIRQKGLAYVHSSFESEASSRFVKAVSEGAESSSEEFASLDRSRNLFRAHGFSDNFYVGIRFRETFQGSSMYRSGIQEDTSGYNAIRFIAEMFPAFILAKGEQMLAVWPPLFYLGLLFSGLAHQLSVWYSVVQGFLHINYRLLCPWETFICFCSCLFAFSASLLMATPLGIHILYFLDYNVGCAWWIMVLHLAVVLAIVLVRGKPYTSQQIAKRFLGPGKCCSSAWSTAPVAFSWTILAPVGLLVLAISSFNTGNFKEVFTWNYLYWPTWVCQVASGTQLFFLILVPSVAVVQTCRFLVNPKWDILLRIQNLYRPFIPTRSAAEQGRSLDASDGDLASRTDGAAPLSPASSGEGQVVPRGETDGLGGPFQDPPPKYTPPPSYSTATGFGFAKNLNRSFRQIRNTIRQLRPDRDPRSRPTHLRVPEPYIPPPDYLRVQQMSLASAEQDREALRPWHLWFPKTSPPNGDNQERRGVERGESSRAQRSQQPLIRLSRSFCKPPEDRSARLRRTLTSSFRRHSQRLSGGNVQSVNADPRSSNLCLCDAFAVSSVSLGPTRDSPGSPSTPDSPKHSEA